MSIWIKEKKRRTSVFVEWEYLSSLKKAADFLGSELAHYFYNDLNTSVYKTKDESERLLQKTMQSSKKDSKFYQKILDETQKTEQKMKTFSKNIAVEHFAGINSQGLAKYLNVLAGSLRDYLYSLILLNLSLKTLSFELNKRLALDQGKTLLSLVDDSKLTLFRDGLLNIACFAFKNGFNADYKNMINNLLKGDNSESISNFFDKELTLNDVDSLVKNLIETVDPQELDQKLRNEREARISKYLNVLDKVTEKDLKEKIMLYQKMMFSSEAFRQSLSFFILNSEKLFKEIAGRLNITLEETSYYNLGELEGLLLSRMVDELELSRRRQGWALLFWEGQISLISKPEFIAGTIKSYEIVSEDENWPYSIGGNVASQGYTLNKARIIKNLKDLDLLEKDDILVAKGTSSEYVLAMKRASGIITDEGGVTCHAALVSREFKIPCIIATNVATKNIKDGDTVFLDANEGIVWVIGQEKNRDEAASKGAENNYLKHVSRLLDFAKIEKNDILVFERLEPEFLPLLYKASKIISQNYSSYCDIYSQIVGKEIVCPN
ncbi:MAG: Phosphoenolpyruvate synthase [candidate division CPR2 bacterium GW2011_GWC1_39_9]|uniref:Phosphoenolpyruvate synthase n=1 Tax=candidate division CPR2 bacterium GW2011_GWC2_39_10 TaxID=1618345 RepID=A0A0G0Q050_UNCC2|nr:MAG: Phosphoenolpyruvate synthase [candidate division CPR2 bacterium GW2011_GWC2_39_10]KKR35650.1 MAG: Phosphoenolpyruvate synthase [candidate division CPR2 bacterium GW2011_GWC1_39_9]